ncbi:hypothetical protein NC651_012682 [Populus alba x Populus x berolinensis]|nr:hypothetical protein NC651_012682 [Populus alba x Populus x berolinensis]
MIRREADGQKPIQVAAARGNREAEETRIVKEIDASENMDIPKRDLPEVSPEAKERAAEAKLRGDDAFRRKEYLTAVNDYTQRFEEAANSFYEGVRLDPENKELVKSFRQFSSP